MMHAGDPRWHTLFLETAGSPGSQFAYNSSDMTLRGPGVGKCLTAVGAAAGPCSLEPAASMPFCDWHLPMPVRVANLVGNLTQAEKLALFGNSAG